VIVAAASTITTPVAMRRPVIRKDISYPQNARELSCASPNSVALDRAVLTNLKMYIPYGQACLGDVKAMRILAMMIGAIALSGCATITRGTTESWSIHTTPSGASVRTSTAFACDATPCTFQMPRKSEFDVTVSKAGFNTWQGHVSRHVAGGGGAGLAGNVLIGGLIGAGVDAASGAMMDLKPNPLNVVLEQSAAIAAAPNPPAAPAHEPISAN